MSLLLSVKQFLQKNNFIETPYQPTPTKPLHDLSFSEALQAPSIIGKVKGIASSIVNIPSVALENRRISLENGLIQKQNTAHLERNLLVKEKQKAFLSVVIGLGVIIASAMGLYLSKK
ncbi:MAG: hypothetical protein WCP39_06750 [Chlamydiota bacterium]